MSVVVVTDAPQDALHTVRVDAGTHHERRGRVAQVVEAHRSRDGSGPQLRPARWAAAHICVLVLLDVRRSAALAAATGVLVTLHEQFYSARRTVIGSSRAALRAGSRLAESATNPSTTDTMTNVIGSRSLTP